MGSTTSQLELDPLSIHPNKEDNYKWEKRSRSRKNRRRGLVLFEKRSLGSSGVVVIFVIHIREAAYYY